MTAMAFSAKRAAATIVGVFLVAGACVVMAGPGVLSGLRAERRLPLPADCMQCIMCKDAYDNMCGDTCDADALEKGFVDQLGCGSESAKTTAWVACTYWSQMICDMPYAAVYTMLANKHTYYGLPDPLYTPCEGLNYDGLDKEDP